MKSLYEGKLFRMERANDNEKILEWKVDLLDCYVFSFSVSRLTEQIQRAPNDLFGERSFTCTGRRAYPFLP